MAAGERGQGPGREEGQCQKVGTWQDWEAPPRSSAEVPSALGPVASSVGVTVVYKWEREVRLSEGPFHTEYITTILLFSRFETAVVWASAFSFLLVLI